MAGSCAGAVLGCFFAVMPALVASVKDRQTDNGEEKRRNETITGRADKRFFIYRTPL